MESATGVIDACFPAAVAVGGKFTLTYTPGSAVPASEAGNPILEAVAPEYMESLGSSQFQALKAGYVGITARSTVDNTIIDYTIVRVEPIASLALKQGASVVPAGLALTQGSSTTLEVTAADASGNALGGASAVAWTTSDPTLLTLGTIGASAAMLVTAGTKSGMATLSVSTPAAPGLSASVVVTVN
jgi:hypothetical protein